ncbi:MAG TPA: M56 family metallopeptidase [Gemmatimonadaceae bacterium]|jgi:beta-lactamase regulating signal transducer with metallopeptidase domain|nr:M56 family metallopeptidase [Gemmatimonadaceae bacterium]
MSDSLRWLSILLITGSTDMTGAVKLLLCTTVMLLIVTVITRFWPYTSAAQRHLLWSAACGGILLAPLFQWLVPRYEVRVLPVVEQVPTRVSVPPTHIVVPPARHQTAKMPAKAVSSATEEHMPAPLPVSPTTSPRAVPWTRVVVLLWGLGTLLVLVALLRSRCQVAALVATAAPLDDPHIRALVDELAAATGWRHQIAIKTQPSVVPMVCGLIRPIIVLPEQALTWTEARLRHVLLHEIAHITRYDMLTQAVASLAVAVYWFHPLVWFAARALRREREHACDDVVLVTERRPTVYATDLLDLTDIFVQSRAVALAALPFARPSHMRERLQAVLDTATYRKRVSLRETTIAWGTVLSVTALVIAITLRSVDTAEAQIFQPRPLYESPVTVAPNVLTTSGDRPTALTLVFENQTDSVTISTPTLGFMRTDTDAAGNLVTETSRQISPDAPTAMPWIHGLPDTVILQPHQRRLVALTITPPHNLADGVYYATINIPEANQRKLKPKEFVNDWTVLSGDWQQAPTVLVLVRHSAPDSTHIHLDSLTLIGSQVCFRMWTDKGTPYFGAISISLYSPRIKTSKTASRATPLAMQERPIAFYGVSSPKHFCTRLVALPGHLPYSQVYADWVYKLGFRRRILPSTFSGPAVLSMNLWGGWSGGGTSNGRANTIPNEAEPQGTVHGDAVVYVSPRTLTP